MFEITGCSGDGTLYIQISEGTQEAMTSMDLVNNPNKESNKLEIIVDNKAPEISISLSNSNKNQLAINETHANSNHVLTITAVIKDENLLDGEIESASLSSNIETGALLTTSELILSGATNDCSVTLISSTKDSSKQITQVFEVTGCSGDGVLQIVINPHSTIDLADNYNDATSNMKEVMIDNTKIGNLESGKVTLEFVSNTNTLGETTHASSKHTIVYKATIADVNLLSSTNATESNNYPGVELTSSMIYAKISGDVTNSCDVSVGEIVNEGSTIQFYQLITLTNCGGREGTTVENGVLTIYIMEDSIYDLADNYNVKSNEMSLVIDNEKPSVTLEFESNNNPLNNTYANKNHILTYVVIIRDTNLLNSENVDGSVNKDYVKIDENEVYAKISSNGNNICEVEVSEPYDLVYSELGEDSFKQRITLTNCSGEGLATIKIVEKATIDVLEIESEESNYLTMTIDNTPVEILIDSPVVVDHFNNTHANENHAITYAITVKDTNLDISNIIEESEIELVANNVTCDYEISAVTDASDGGFIIFKQVLTISNCTGNGTIGFKIKETDSTSLVIDNISVNDLANNRNSEISSTTVIIDNILPVATVVLTSTTNDLNNTHVNKDHTTTFIVTMEDVYLHEGMLTSGNLSSEVEVVVSEWVTGCTFTIENVATTSKKIIQKVLVSGCEGDGTMSIKVKPSSNIKDKADNDILETSTIFTIDGSVVRDNNGREITNINNSSNFVMYSEMDESDRINYYYDSTKKEIYTYKDNDTSKDTFDMVSSVVDNKFTLQVVVDNISPGEENSSDVTVSAPRLYTSIGNVHNNHDYANRAMYIEYTVTFKDLNLFNDYKISETINEIEEGEIAIYLGGSEVTCSYVTSVDSLSSSSCTYYIYGFENAQLIGDNLQFSQRILIQGITSSGELTFTVKESATYDLANNPNISNSHTGLIIDNVGPIVTISAPTINNPVSNMHANKDHTI